MRVVAVKRIPVRLDHRRSGITLVEVMVVIAIIAILASLLTVGVFAVMGKGPEAKNRWEMQKLSLALDKFYAEKKVYPPSKIKLYASAGQYTTDALDQQSLRY